MIEKVIYTADDEEPSCSRCDNALMPDTWCMNNCGGAYSWAGYIRIAPFEIGDDNEINRR